MRMTSYDVAIVGLGAMGSAAAWQLSARGLRVLGLDRHTPPHHFGSSHGHARIIREAYFEHPQYVPFVQRAYRLWDSLAAATGADLMRRTGGLMIGREDGPLVTGARTSAQLHHLPCELWSAADVSERVPALSPDAEMVALWEPRAGVLVPERAVDAMLGAARAAGTELVYDTVVTGWTADRDGVTLATRTQDFHAARAIFAAGPWLTDLLPTLSRFGEVLGVQGVSVTLGVRSSDVAPQVAEALVRGGYQLYGLVPSHQSLEEVFLSLVDAASDR